MKNRRTGLLENNRWFLAAWAAANRSLQNAPLQSISHQHDHLLRVARRAIWLASLDYKVGEIDFEALALASLLHDIDEPFNDKRNHVKRSMRKAQEILREIGYPTSRIQKVLVIIKQHSSENVQPPSVIEAKILFDADKLDGLGVVGIARVFMLSGQRGISMKEAIEWYHRKIGKALPMMQTKLGARLAQEQLVYVEEFLSELERTLKS